VTHDTREIADAICEIIDGAGNKSLVGVGKEALSRHFSAHTVGSKYTEWFDSLYGLG
jgi:hypothetical protein